jgi:hypothetical protein
MLHRQSRERADDLSALGVVRLLALGGQRWGCRGHWMSKNPRPLSCARPTLGQSLLHAFGS